MVSTLHEEFRSAINDGDDRLREMVNIEHTRLREHIDQQIAQIRDAHEVNEQQIQLALEAAEKLELERIRLVEAKVESGDARIDEHLASLKEKFINQIEASRLAVSIAQEANAKAIDKALTSVDQRFSEMQRALDTARSVATQAVDKAENTTRQRMDEGDTRLREHIGAQVGQIKDALDAARRETQFSHDASEKAISKAEAANEKRFESMNEFRGQLADQASGFIPREVHEQAVKGLEARIHALELTKASGGGEAAVERRKQDSVEKWHIWAAGGILSVILVAANVLTSAG